MKFNIDYKFIDFGHIGLGHVENLNIFEGIQNQDYSVEHIMPQTLNSDWKEELGENHQDIHHLYLNSIGNLTLTGYNF